jgi:sulfonate transport system substrate-binding protein
MNLRKYFVAFMPILLVLIILLNGCAAIGRSDPAPSNKVVKIGYQKSSMLLILKTKHILENDLSSLGYSVQWFEFSTGMSVMEALHTGNIDFGVAGDAPSLFALAKNMSFVYVASEPSSPQSEGILVKKDSAIRTLADLKGKKVAYNKASISQYLLQKALSSAGLRLEDIQSVYLNPPDASVAFANGSVDAWVVWDPYVAVAEKAGNRLLVDGKGLVPYRTLYLSSRSLADNNPELVKKIVQALKHIGLEVQQNPRAAAQILSTATQIDESAWETVLKRKSQDVNFMDGQALQDLQQEADDFAAIGLIPRKVSVKEAAWLVNP